MGLKLNKSNDALNIQTLTNLDQILWLIWQY